MHRKDPRKPCRVHDRKIDRNVCRVALKKGGVHRPNKSVKEEWRNFSEQEA